MCWNTILVALRCLHNVYWTTIRSFLKKWQAVGKSASIDLGEHSESNGSMIFTFHGAKQYYFLILTLQDCSLFCSVTSGLIRPVLSGTFSVLWPTKVTNTDQSDHFWKDCFTLSKRRNLWTIEDWHMSVLTVTCVLSKNSIQTRQAISREQSTYRTRPLPQKRHSRPHNQTIVEGLRPVNTRADDSRQDRYTWLGIQTSDKKSWLVLHFIWHQSSAVPAAMKHKPM